MTEEEYLKYRGSRTPEERLTEMERLRTMFLDAYPFLPRRLVKIIRKRKLQDPEEEIFDLLYKKFYLNNKERISKINS